MPRTFKPNPVRQAVLVVLALVGIGIGYGLGFLLKTDPPPAPAAAVPQTTHPGESQDLTQVGAPAKAPLETPATATPKKEPAGSAAKPVLPEDHTGEGRPRAYEEALPETIVHFPAITIPPPVERVAVTPEIEAAPGAAVEIEATPQDGAPPAPQLPAEMPVAEPAADAAAELAARSPQPETSSEKAPAAATVELADGWLEHALAVTLTDKPKIAIVIDDMGVDIRRSQKASNLRGPLTLAYLTYARDLNEQTKIARRAGHELMLHVPMEPASRDIDPGPNVLLSGVPATETLSALDWGLDQFTGYVGVNNHMGSRFTSDLEGMKTLMQALKKRRLFFLDSVTSGETKGRIAAQQIGVPFIARNIFLDHIDDIEQVRRRLAEVERLALKQGYAVAIGHPRDATLEALAPWLETIESKGFQLVPVSALIRQAAARETASAAPPADKEK